jgi:hypothetical protein
MALDTPQMEEDKGFRREYGEFSHYLKRAY